jgi:ATP-dependent Clp protease ATP-binding subunit ClpC
VITMPELSQGASIAWRLAAGETTRSMHPCIEKEFVFIGLCNLGRWLRSQQQGSKSLPQQGPALQALHTEAQTVEEVLKACTLAPDLLRQAVRAVVGKGTSRHPEEIVHRSTACKMCFRRAEAMAESAGAVEVHCLHLLAAILEQPGACITRVVTDFGVDMAALQAQVQSMLGSLETRQSQTESEAGKPYTGPSQMVKPQAATDTPYLDRYGRDITHEAREGKLDPIIGRKEEILALVRALYQKTKNLPVLISEPGVSRVAVVKGLALRIACENVVAPLRGKRLVELHRGDLTLASMPPSQFAQCLQQMVEEASRNPDVFLFIDEIHTVVRAGSEGGWPESAHVLKAALGKGNIRCIGATTIEYYQRYIESDSLLERRCQPILVNEPSIAEMQEILAHVRLKYEQYHMVTITPEALEAAVELSAKHLLDKRFPEKAIDLLDQACSQARISQITQLESLEALSDSYEVTRETIAAVVAQKTGIPVGRLLEAPRARLQRLAKELQAQVQGTTEDRGA